MANEPIEAILRDAGVTIEPGMLLVERDNTAGGRVLQQRPGGLVLVYTGGGNLEDWHTSDCTPDLTDPATYALCLAQLARRLGLDPEQGAHLGFDKDDLMPRFWWVETNDGAAVLADIPTDIDHRRALALALRATAPKETT